MRAASTALLAILTATTCATTPIPTPSTPTTDPTPTPNLIPRAVLFGNPERTAAQLSPDGRWLSWLAPHNNVLNVWVAPANDLTKPRPVTAADLHPVLEFEWTFDGKHLLYWQDKAGNENDHVYRVAIETGEVVDLTPLDNVRAGEIWLSHRKPSTLLVELNDRDSSVFDVHAIDLTTGERRLVARNDHKFTRWIFDHDLELRLAQKMADSGALVWMEKRGNGWRHFDETPPPDALGSRLLSFDGRGTALYTLDSRGRDTAALFVVDAKTKHKRLVHADARADLGGSHQSWIGPSVLMHPTEQTVQAIVVDPDKPSWVILDPRVANDFAALAKLDPGVPRVTSRTLDDTTWIVAFDSDVRSRRYYRWDRPTQHGELLFVEQPELDRQPLVPMHPVTIASRDGLALVSYLTLPAHADRNGDAKADQRVPMVLLVHGGPWYRDRWGFDRLHQLFANRGYAVLSVNFRGSTGLGKAFTNAGDMQWGKKMHDDLLDAVTWAVDQGVADKDEVCIAGYSYGGYATLIGLTLTPEVFTCGVDIVGPSNLVTVLENVPPYWLEGLSTFRQRLGDWTTPEGKQALLDISPLTHVANITKPLLIGHGANDTRAKRSESDQIVAAMQANNIPVGYVVFPDEGHFFNRPENNRAFFAVVEAFLSVHLGGWYQPIDDAEIAASSMVVEAGREWLPGLAEPR